MKAQLTGFALILITLLHGLPLPSLADEVRSMQVNGRLSVEAQAGDFVFVGHDQDRLVIVGGEAQGLRPAIRGDHSHWSVQFSASEPGDGQIGDKGPIEIRLPQGAELEVRLGQGTLSVSALHGPLIQLRAIGGSVHIRGSQPARLFVETVDADQRLDGLARDETRLSSVDGAIRARGDGQRLALQTVSGPVRLDVGELVDLELQSLSGDTQVRVRPSTRAVLRARSHSAPLVFLLPEETALVVRAESHQGSIDSVFGGAVEIAQNGNRQLVHGAGPGRVRLELRSVEGPISVRELRPPARLLVYREPLSDWSPGTTAIHRGRLAVPPRDGEIVVGIDREERVRLRPAQYSLLELPLDSTSLFARQEGWAPVELEVVTLEPVLYCFRLRQIQQLQGSREFPALREGFEFGQVECPAADHLSDYQEIAAGPGD